MAQGDNFLFVLCYDESKGRPSALSLYSSTVVRKHVMRGRGRGPGSRSGRVRFKGGNQRNARSNRCALDAATDDVPRQQRQMQPSQDDVSPDDGSQAVTVSRSSRRETHDLDLECNTRQIQPSQDDVPSDDGTQAVTVSRPSRRETHDLDLECNTHRQLLGQAPIPGSGLAMPGPNTVRSRQLLHLVFSEQMDSRPACRAIWVPILVSFQLDEAVLYSMLTIFAAVFSKDDREALNCEAEVQYYYGRALRSIQDRLGNPKEVNSDAIVAAIAGFAGLSRLSSKTDEWKLHMQGLKRIVESRGGTDTIKAPSLRTTVLLIDAMGCCDTDTRPSLSLPSELLPSLDHIRTAYRLSVEAEIMMAAWLEKWPRRTAIAQILQDLAVLTNWTSDQDDHQHPLFFGPPARSGPWLHVLHRCLNLRPQAASAVAEDEGAVMQEALRQGVIIYLRQLRHAFGFTPKGARYRTRRLRAVLSARLDWKGLTTLLLWIVVVAAIEAGYIGEQAWFAGIIATHPLLRTMSDGDIIYRLRRFIWVDEFIGQKLRQLLLKVAEVRVTGLLASQGRNGQVYLLGGSDIEV